MSNLNKRPRISIANYLEKTKRPGNVYVPLKSYSAPTPPTSTSTPISLKDTNRHRKSLNNIIMSMGGKRKTYKRKTRKHYVRKH